MSSNYAELRDEKVKEIEEILKSYLPEQNGYQRIIMDAMEYLSLIHILNVWEQRHQISLKRQKKNRSFFLKMDFLKRLMMSVIRYNGSCRQHRSIRWSRFL